MNDKPENDDRTPAALVPLVHESAPLRHKIAQALRHAIEIGELQPGMRIVEKDLCQTLNVSRTSLREALRELQAEKLIKAVPRGLVVAEITDEEASNIYRVRAALEGLVAAQFAERANEMDAHLLEKALNRLERAYRFGDFEEILTEKRRFYDVICKGARNSIVRDILGHLGTRINQLRSTSRSNAKRGAESLAELKELANALFARNAKAARAAAIKHIDAAAQTASKSLHEEAPGPSRAKDLRRKGSLPMLASTSGRRKSRD